MNTTVQPVVRRILIADDNHASRELLRRMLKHMTRAELYVAVDGEAALLAYSQLRPQISFLDIDMPGQDGLSVLAQIRAVDAEVFIVMVSAHSGVEAVQSALQQGVSGYIVKPYSAQRVLDVLQRYVAKTGDIGILAEPDDKPRQ